MEDDEGRRKDNLREPAILNRWLQPRAGSVTLSPAPADNLITTLLEGGREPFVWPSIRQ